ncbi:ATPase AAA [Sorangium cellulosum]|uniref:ATPase AAA n=1 Tax=Sorangium cellulosum TaxID=56 RepID=A0A2L0EYI7_SORCE|nr:sigma 54-interacting transcriptional regulator [Sorangium cellulosum]AUX44309.1 ATPase AAA [Sorangium cellulosum]
MREDSTTLVRTKRRAGSSAEPRPFLFLVLQCQRPLDPPARLSLDGVDEVSFGRGAARSFLRRSEGGRALLDVRLEDGWISSRHARITRDGGRLRLEDLGSTNGTFVNGVPQRSAALAEGDLIELGHTFFLFREVPAADDAPPAGDQPFGLATFAPALVERFTALRAVAPARIPVVLQGESGTGKEVIARAIHALSGRPGPFVAINCGALPDSLVESELFGHKKGAFSGAAEDRPGLIRAADKGTLFLDEIGDLPAASQTAFLRVLQESEVVAVGATRPVKVDLRVVVATHRDLPAMVERGDFRGDLFARLSGFVLELPPLRRRREDLGLLIAALLRRAAPDRAAEVSMSCEAARALLLREWRLNVRELEKCLATAVVLAGSGRVELDHLPPPVGAPRSSLPPEAPRSEAPSGERHRSAAEDQERREALIRLFREHRGNISAVARAMGKGRTQIHRWIARYGIEPADYRDG